MLKILEMPRRTQPEPLNCTMHCSMILPDVYEESESLGSIQRWLQIVDSALENEPTSERKRSAQACSTVPVPLPQGSLWC